MKRLLLLLCACAFGLPLIGQADRTASPYFHVSKPGSDGQNLALRHTEAEVSITAEIADVVITQVYQNTGQQPLEATYVFPASTRAAVYAMSMQIGDRIIDAKIKEKEEARNIYEEAKVAGQTASLLEQERANVFQMSVANILPGDSIVVKLSFTEFIESQSGTYQFVYPTVVGPRYVSPSQTETENTQENWTGQPYLKNGNAPPYTFSFKGQIQGGGLTPRLSCETHALEIATDAKGKAEFRINPNEGFAGNRDIIIEYQLQTPQIEAGLMTYKEKGEKFFLLNIQPPKRVRVAKEDLKPREYVFIMDVSGSMYGFPLNVSKALMADLLQDLNPQDRFNVLQFAGGSTVLSPDRSLSATPENIQKGLAFVDQPPGGGGTELMPALKRAYGLKGTEGFIRTFVICTDGYVSVEKDAMDLIQENNSEVGVFTFGIGSSVNRLLIEGMARAGGGDPVVVTNQANAEAASVEFREKIEAPVLTDIWVDFGEMGVYEVEPQHIPNLYRSSPISIFGKYKGKLAGKLILTGNNAAGEFQQVIELDRQKPDPANRALRYLWARERLRQVQDFRLYGNDEEQRKQIAIELGLQYNLLTNYTSFVAVDRQQRNPGIENTTTPTPLPLPEGVNNSAISGAGTTLIRGITTTSSHNLDEVVVVGYGMQKSAALSGKIVCVQVTDDGNRVYYGGASLANNLAGQVTGLWGVPTSGAPGSAHNFSILAAPAGIYGGQPLMTLDGQPLQGDVSQWGMEAGGSPQTNLLDVLDPRSISSITIQKSARPGSGYGSANGVMDFHTERGINGRSTLRFDVMGGLQQPVRRYELAGYQAYLDAATEGDISPWWQNLDNQDSADWQNRLIRSQAMQQYRLVYDWGKNNFQVHTGASYLHQPGIVQQSGQDRFRGWSHLTYAHKGLDVGLRVVASHARQDVLRSDNLDSLNSIRHLLQAAPTVGNSGSALLDEQGLPFLYQPDSSLRQLANRQIVNRFIPQLRVGYSFLDHFRWQSEAGLDWVGMQQENASVRTFSQTYQGSLGYHGHSLDYNRSFGNHRLSALLKSQFQQYTLDRSGDLHSKDQLAWNASYVQATIKENWDDWLVGELTLNHQWINRGGEQSGVWQPAASLRLNLYDRLNWNLQGGWGQQGLHPYSSRLSFPTAATASWTRFQQTYMSSSINLWDYRITLSVEGFFRRSLDLPVLTHTDATLDLRQFGGEFYVDSRIGIRRGMLTNRVNFTWIADGQILRSDVPNSVTNLDQRAGIELTQSYQFNQPWGVFWGYETLQSPNGEFGLMDANDDGQVTPEDQTVIGRSQPQWYGGWVGKFTYKKLSLSWALQAAGGHKVLNLQRFYGSENPDWVHQTFADVANSGAAIGPEGITDRMLEDATFLRLGQLLLSYRFNTKDKLLPDLEVALLGENLWVLSAYEGFDPWVNSMGQTATGLVGIDAGAFPRSRNLMIQFGFSW